MISCIFRLLIKSRGFVDKESDSVDKGSGKSVDKGTPRDVGAHLRRFSVN